MKADNTKIILLSGTPIINYPNEIAILFNMLEDILKHGISHQLTLKDV